MLYYKVTHKMINEIEEQLCGTCEFFDLTGKAEELGVDEYDLACAIDDAEIFNCDFCGWWQYPGDVCNEHAHEGTVCASCCEYEDV